MKNSLSFWVQSATGKSRLSIDLATHISPSEIINSDKMHFYRGLDIQTNKIALEERRELSEYFEKEMETYSPAIKKLIGVNAFKTYFNVFPPRNTNGNTSAIKECTGSNVDMKPNGKYQESDYATLKKNLLEEAIQTMKVKAYELAKRQVEKIKLFRSSGWNILKLDAT
ncbi:hypothetical protein MKW92_025521 [Papaver armeniacum]|nr:hypothetical protein MKW92_025521 [Papaver armeniacum]